MDDDILVSVYCLAYNHENYIRDALEGFVMQKTNFRFEVVINDDASTDGTAAIICEYAERYPDIFVPIYQTENQYSKNVRMFETIIYPHLRGKYFASCEGDDYWTDENKLQRQVDFLESHPDYSACTHNNLTLNMYDNDLHVEFQDERDETLQLRDIAQDGGTCFRLASMMYRREFCFLPPEFLISVGDYPMAVYLALVGKIYYFKDCMHVYRFGVPGSWTANNWWNTEKRIALKKEVNDMLRGADRFSGRKYHKLFQSVIRKNEYEVFVWQGNYRAQLSPKYRAFRQDLSKEEKKTLIKRAHLRLFHMYVFVWHLFHPGKKE